MEDFLLEVRKPARYIGQEWNAAKKDFQNCPVKFALCFPDLYEVGMSNLGIRIMYGLLNQIPDACCERFFAPAQDMEDAWRSRSLPLVSLETRRGLSEFDIVGFSLSYELCYTNVLNMLELGGIPLKAAQRDHQWPLVIAGGPCALNPEPMHDFFDLFVIGEAEEVILEITDIYRRHKDDFKSEKLGKQDLLTILSRIEGVYVPSAPRNVRKRFIADLDNSFFPSEWLVPYIEIVHDRIILEIMRGCPNQCRFCQARNQYYPFRKRSAEKVMELARVTYESSGYEELSLAGLSVSDYPGIEGLSRCLIDTFKEKGVAVSLPSIKPKANLGAISSVIAGVKKTSLTFAPEAATERLRSLLNKDFNTEVFFKALDEAYMSGYQRVKLYFMIGLPQETEADLDAIIDFADQASQARKKTGGPAAFVNLSVNTLIPKPHTALQWMAMESLEGIKYKQDYLRKKLKNKRIDLNFHDREMSFLEAVFSRGDRRLSRVILTAFKKGARFDAWRDHFNLDRWMEAFAEVGIDPESYLREKPVDSALPWDFIDTGVAKETLVVDYKSILSENRDRHAFFKKRCLSLFNLY